MLYAQLIICPQASQHEKKTQLVVIVAKTCKRLIYAEQQLSLYLKWGLFFLCSNTKLQCDIAMLSLSRVRVDDKGLLLSRVGDGAKRIEQSTHEVITSVDCLLSNKSAENSNLQL